MRGLEVTALAATAGIGPAMKVLQASRYFFALTREFLCNIANGAPG
jgi:hypothetical protein